MEHVFTKNAPTPAGHYSQAVVHNNLVYISGQVPINPVTGEKVLKGIEEQTHQVLKNMIKILEASNSSLNHLLKVTIYVSDIALWDKVNNIYSEVMGNHKPARTIVPTRDLHYGFKVEMDAIAAVRINS